MKSSPGSGAGGTAISEPRLALPKGGGAVSGIGEKFAANPVTGSGSMTVPIAVSPGRAGFGPALSLAYDSATGNGPFGFGWGLGLSAITRKTDKGVPQYAGGADPDVFILAGAEDLVPELAGEPGGLEPRRETRAAFGATYEVSRYRPRIEGLFARIERWTSASDPADTFWRSISRDNVTTWYGRTPESRVFDPADPRRTFNWLVCETHDDRGNVVSYGYKPEDSQGIDPMQLHERNRTEASRSANRYLKRIRYGNRLPYFPDLADSPRTPLPTDWCFEVVFDYGEHDAVDPHPVHEPQPWMRRNDPLSSYRAGFEVRTYRLCQRVLMFHHFAAEPEVGENCLVRATELEYSFEADPADARNPVYSFLIAATQAGFRRRAEGGLRRSAMPAIEFEYSQPVIDDRIRDVDPESLRNLPHGVDGVGYRWIDLDGDGVPGILADQGERWHYKRNESPAVDPDDATGTSTRFGPLQVLLAQASHAAPGATQLLDLAGDGSVDLVELEGPAPGFCERTPEGGWSGHTPFRSLPAIAWSDPNVRFIDLTGDGHADVLVTENDAWCWHASLAETGFGPAQRAQKALDDETGPRVAFADTTQSIFLADLSGDGLTDIVRIRNGEVCYWPNLGHGRFGAKVGMDHAPWFDAPDAFDPRRIHLADIDGSGTTDIVYLSGTGVRIYFNQSGNGWSPARRLAQFPASDSVASATVVDLLGNGTACLVWSSPLAADSRRPMRYIDLMGGQKPHLLVTARNNLGAETQVRYAPSTRFYMQDRAAGTTWPTRLPFPVHVVERVETIDRVSGNRFVTRYRYRHGFFDGPEREFRGFGRVDQWDTETIGALRPDDTEATNIDAASYVPPVHTRTWFHTGAWLDDPAISRQFAAEYYREPSLDDAEAHAQLLADTILPAGLTFQEAREACRALKGSMLRQEVYAEDGSPHAAIPYTVSEQSFAIAPVQPRGGNRHAVFFVHQRESISLQYERNPADPRVAHRLMLAVDDFGNVLRSAEIAYGRRQADAALLPQDRDRQTLPLATVDDNDFTNAVDLPDAYRTPAPSQTRRHELTGLVLSDGQDQLTFEEVEQAIAQAQDIPHEATPDGSRQRRLIAQSRTLYRPNDLSGALPLGQVESLGLPFETRRLVFTPGLPAHVFGDRVDEAMLAEGGYVHGEPDGDWWVPSDRSFLSPDTSDTADVEFTFARQHFFQMQRRQDPFGNVATVGYDAHDLLLITTRDALNNTREAINDYRVLQPRLVTDANGNRTEAAFDTLGVVVGIAVMGKPDEGVGDSLQGLAADLDDETVAAHLETPLVDPHSILQGATTRVVYDLFAYERTQADAQPQPAVVYTLSRATHRSDLGPDELTRVRHAFAYADGFGREIQKKAQAESGPVDADVLNPRWVGSGWTVFNNKGKPVRQFEPFFSATHRFEFDRQQGVGSVLFYDPLERVVATLQPNHTWEKVVFDPWRQATWDANDTVLIVDPADDPDVGDLFRRLPTADYLPTWHAQRIDGSLGSREQSAARKTAVHANTPATAHLDPLGRPFLTVAHNRFERDGTTVDEDHSTRVELDIDGRQRSVRDAIVQAGDPLGRIVVRRDYDMLGNPVHSASMEAGERWTLGDVAGTPIRAWDSRGHAVRTEYDALRRPLRQFVRGHDPHDPTAELLFGRTDYGEGEPDETPNNLRTRVVRLFDSAGIETRVAYDYKGNVLRSHRRFAAEYRSHPDWAGEPTLEPEQFDTSTTYDALDRAVAIITPDGSVTRPAYNEANLLERLTVNLRAAAEATLFVANVDYNAKGQRTRIEHGNGVSTTYEYDDRTFRLVRIHTRRGGDVLQDLSYTFDPVGNVSDRRDEAQQTIWFDNTVVEPHADYTYDAVYRLVAATGREHIGQLAASHTNWNDEGRVRLPHPHDGQAMRRYTERYEYDAAGNFLRFIHQANQGDWTRSYGYEEPSLVEPQKRSNRLSQTAVGASSETYAHDAHGNITTIPHLSLMRWDFQDRLQATARQVVNDGTPQTSRYVYDSNGQRVRKITERQTAPGEAPSRMNERLYLGGFEVYRDYTSDGGTVALERQTLHVIDDQHRLARVETRTQGSDGTPAQLVRYQFGDHLESACVELDADAAIVSYEEFHPFGSTAYQAGRSPADVTSKRHRYTAKERDEESGFCYHGARYYAPWLGRWTAADPMPARAASNLYLYTDDRPTAFVDDNGAEKKKPPFLDQGKSYERVWFDHYKNHPRVTEVFQQQTIKDPKTGKTQKFEGVSKRSPDLWMKVKDGPTTVVEVGRQGKTFESPEKLRQMSIDRDAVKRGLYIGPAEGPQFKIEAQMQKSGLPIVGKGGNAHLADEAPQPEHFDEEKVKRNKEKIAAAKEAKAASLADEAADEAGEFSKYAKKGVKWGSRVVPVLGAIVTLTAPGDASAAERVVRAVAGEIGIGPVDLETAYDLTVLAGEKLRGTAVMGLDEVKFHTGTLDDPVRDATRLMEVVEQSRLRR